jgi:sialate O-acetylesterase
VAVRFAWREDAEPNLINKEGLPASPFRTDPWRGVTEGRD